MFKVHNLILEYHSVSFKNAVDIENKVFANKHRISDRQVDIMFLIEELKLNSLSQMSKELDLSLSSLSLTISKMVDNNLLTKNYEENEQDGRVIFLEITEQGMNFYLEIKSFVKAALREFLESLDEKEYSLYSEMVKNLSFIGDFISESELDTSKSIEYQIEIIYRNLIKMRFLCEKIFKSLCCEENQFMFEKGMILLALMIKYDLHTPSELSERSRTSESTVSTQLKALIKKDLAYKKKQAGDSRKTYFYATEEGIDIYNKCQEYAQKTLTTFIEKLDESLKVHLSNGLYNLIVLFELLLKK